jgi:hypothetical protein
MNKLKNTNIPKFRLGMRLPINYCNVYSFYSLKEHYVEFLENQALYNKKKSKSEVLMSERDTEEAIWVGCYTRIIKDETVFLEKNSILKFLEDIAGYTHSSCCWNIVYILHPKLDQILTKTTVSLYENKEVTFYTIPYIDFFFSRDNFIFMYKANPKLLSNTVFLALDIHWKQIGYILKINDVHLTSGSNNKKHLITTNQFKISMVLNFLMNSTFADINKSFKSEKRLDNLDNYLKNLGTNYLEKNNINWIQLNKYLLKNKYKYSEISDNVLINIENEIKNNRDKSTQILDIDLELELRKRRNKE